MQLQTCIHGGDDFLPTLQTFAYFANGCKGTFYTGHGFGAFVIGKYPQNGYAFGHLHAL